MDVESVFRARFAEVRAAAAAALMEGREGRWEVCRLCWVAVTRICLKDRLDGVEQGPVWSVCCTYSRTSDEQVTGDKPDVFAGSIFDLHLDVWEEVGLAHVANAAVDLMGMVRQAGLRREQLLGLWDHTLALEVLGA